MHEHMYKFYVPNDHCTNICIDWIPWRLYLIPGKFIYDEIDIEAYKKKKGQRVSWSPYEDSLVMNSSFSIG